MRSLQICWILAKYLLFYKFTRYRQEIFGQRLKLAFEELGITFIKIGQIMSMRYDLLSEQNCQALQGLLSDVKPVPYSTIVAIVEREYGKPLSQMFKSFDEQPLGSASVSQVHKAELFDGSIVAVKVKRPEVDTMFFYDIRILKRLTRFSELFFRTLRHVQIREMINYFEGWIKQDLDFRLEVRNMRRFKEEYGFAETKYRPDLGRQIIPKAFESLCTEHVIVMDYIEGIPLNQVERIKANPAYDIEKSVRLFVNAPMRYWFGQDRAIYIFQADPHMSNILALPNGDVANIDFGLISQLTLEEAGQVRDLVLAVYLQDLDGVLRIAADMTGGDFGKREPRIRADVQAYLLKAQKSGFGYWFMELVKIMVKHRLRFPLFMTAFGRGHVVADGMMKTYLPNHTTSEILGVELRVLAFRQVAKNILNSDWTKLALVLSEQVRKTPNIVAEFIDDPLSIITKIARAVKSTT